MKTPIPIYVINLKRNPERKLFIQRQLDAFNLSYQFVDAIDKYNLESPKYRSHIAQSLGIDPSDLENKYAKIIGHDKTRRKKSKEEYKNKYLGQLAIILSHIKVYNLMVQHDDKACVLEDDVTLLPTFPAVLEAASTSLWDILLLSSGSNIMQFILYGSSHSHPSFTHINAFIRRLSFVLYQLKTKSNARKKHENLTRLLEKYSFDLHTYPNQSKMIIEALQEYDAISASIIAAYLPKNLFTNIIKSANTSGYINAIKKLLSDTNRQYNALNWHISTQLGVLPTKQSLKAITTHHCIAEPRKRSFSAMAYIVKQSAAVKWKHKALGDNFQGIDLFPWDLYMHEKVKLRIITPPCVIAAYSYLVHSAHYHY